MYYEKPPDKLGGSCPILQSQRARNIDDVYPTSPNQSMTWVSHVTKWGRQAQTNQQVSGEAIFHLPYPRQFIVDGTLRQSFFTHHSNSLHLFWDLVFVGAIQQTSHVLFVEAERDADSRDRYSLNITGESLGYYIIIYFVMWKTWVIIERWSQIFGANDVLHRLIIVWEMCLVVGMGSELRVLYRVDDNVFVGCFCLARLTIVLLFAISMLYLPMFRRDLLLNIVFQTIPIVIWFVSIWAPLKNQWAFYLAASIVELVLSFCMATIRSIARRFQVSWRYHLAIDVNRTSKRFGEFIMLTLGEYVLNSFIRGNGDMDSRIGRAALGMVIVSSIHWTYFHSEGSRLSQHALTRSWLASTAWSLLHPLLGSLLAIGCSSMSRLVKRDEEGENPSAVTWAFCAGMGGAYITLALLGFTHRSLDEVHYTYVSKPRRLGVRAAAGALIILLGLAHGHLDRQIHLPLIVACLTFSLMIFEMIGRLRRHVDANDVDYYDAELAAQDNMLPLSPPTLKRAAHIPNDYRFCEEEIESNTISWPRRTQTEKPALINDAISNPSPPDRSGSEQPMLPQRTTDPNIQVTEEQPRHDTPASRLTTAPGTEGAGSTAGMRWSRSILVTQIGARINRQNTHSYDVRNVPGAAECM